MCFRQRKWDILDENEVYHVFLTKTIHLSP